jgi:hypothetical protein
MDEKGTAEYLKELHSYLVELHKYIEAQHKWLHETREALGLIVSTAMGVPPQPTITPKTPPPPPPKG